jgi:hypothetical protein
VLRARVVVLRRLIVSTNPAPRWPAGSESPAPGGARIRGGARLRGPRLSASAFLSAALEHHRHHHRQTATATTFQHSRSAPAERRKAPKRSLGVAFDSLAARRKSLRRLPSGGRQANPPAPLRVHFGELACAIRLSNAADSDPHSHLNANANSSSNLISFVCANE